MHNPSVLVDGEKEESSHEELQRDAKIVIVTSHETHIWIHGTHYTTVGEVTDSDDVSPGDLFFVNGSESGICQIHQVLSINESSGEDKHTVDFGLVYSEGERINEVTEPPYSDAHSNMHVEQGMSIGHFTGLENSAMGYTGPPVKLEKVETE
jgi:hypothetical protein